MNGKDPPCQVKFKYAAGLPLTELLTAMPLEKAQVSASDSFTGKESLGNVAQGVMQTGKQGSLTRADARGGY